MIRRLGLSALLALALAFSPATAAGAESHPFLAETDGAPLGSGAPPTGPFEDACGVALDSHGDRYVADYYDDAVDVFGPAGEYLTQVAAESDGNGPCGLAVDAAGRLYIDNWRAEVVRYTPSAYPPAPDTSFGERTVIDPAGTATGIAVDPVGGALYVDDGTYIAHFEAPVGAGETPDRIGEGSLVEGYGLARSTFAATAGDLYVADAAAGLVRVFGPAGEALAPIDAAGSPQGGFDHLVDSNLAVDPTDGHLLVADNLEYRGSEHPAMAIDEFTPAGAYRGQIARWTTHPAGEPGVVVEHSLQTGEPSGLAVDPSGDVYVTAGNSDGSETGMRDRDGKPVAGSLLYTFGPAAAAAPLSVVRSGSGSGTVTSAPAGIACGPACTAEYDAGAKVTLTATPGADSSFAGWSGDCSGLAGCTVTMSAARSVGAEFVAVPQPSLTVATLGSGQGSLTSEPAGIQCGSLCSEPFEQGSTVTLLATPASGSRLVGWSGCSAEPGPGRCLVAMSEARSVAVEFAPLAPPPPVAAGTGIDAAPGSSPPGAPCPRACPALARLSLGRLTDAGLEASVSAPGRLSVAGPGLKRSGVLATAPGPLILPLDLTGRSHRRLARDGRLPAALTVTLTPDDGGAVARRTERVLFAAPAPPRRRTHRSGRTR